MTTKSNLLKISDVKKKAKAAKQQEVYTLRDGSDFKFFPIFTETKIEDLLVDLQGLLSEADEKDYEISDRMMFHLTNLLIIKHFSHLKAYIRGNVLNHIECLEALRDGGYYKEIMNEVFDPKEVQKVRDVMIDKVAEFQILEEMTNKMIERIEELRVKNDNLLKALDKTEENKPLQ